MNIPKTNNRPWNIKAGNKPWNQRDESGKPFANAKRFKGEFYHTTYWRNLRAFYIKSHPICQECERNGKTVKGYFVDHIIPISQGGEPLNQSNLQTLCRACHASKTNKEIANNKNNK